MRHLAVTVFAVLSVLAVPFPSVSADPLRDAIVPLAPGLTISTIRMASYSTACNSPSPPPSPWECNAITSSSEYRGGSTFGFDATGRLYQVAFGSFILPSGEDAFLLRRINTDGTEEPLAHLIASRCDTYPCSGESYEYLYAFPVESRFDVTLGRILLAMRYIRHTPQGQNDDGVGIVEVSGFPKMFDTLLTFIPGGQLAALMPAHPDGFRSADSMQVWTGDVRSMPDWSQAQPLTCEAATNPAPGQIVTVADTLPDPALGAGRYYLTATQHAADRRLGRQYVNGAFSARNPASLPVCAP